jgi:hypothetical protein
VPFVRHADALSSVTTCEATVRRQLSSTRLGGTLQGNCPIDEPAEAQLAEALAWPNVGPARAAPNLAVRLQDVVIHDAGKWFGGAEIRLDALVVHGG